MSEKTAISWCDTKKRHGAQCGCKNPFWKGGKSKTPHGYVLVLMPPGHHLANAHGYAYEHRVVAEKTLGRRLRESELVHHINGIKTDNRPENLEIVASNAEHFIKHRRAGCARRLPHEPNPIIHCECGCGTTFQKYDDDGRPRRFVSGHNGHEHHSADRMIAMCDGVTHVSVIAERTGKTKGAVVTMASKLERCGRLVRIRKGIYGRKN